MPNMPDTKPTAAPIARMRKMLTGMSAIEGKAARAVAFFIVPRAGSRPLTAGSAREIDPPQRTGLCAASTAARIDCGFPAYAEIAHWRTKESKRPRLFLPQPAGFQRA